jgi:hypothetical protein
MKQKRKKVCAYIDGVKLKGDLIKQALDNYITLDERKKQVIAAYPQYKVTFKSE